MPSPRDYIAKGWPQAGEVVDQFPLHSTGGDIAMFMLVQLVAEGGVLVAQKAAAGATNVKVAVDDYDAYDVQSAGKLPVWLNVSGKVIETPHADTTGLAVGDEVEVKAAGIIQKKASAAAVGKVASISGDGDVRVILY
jgi:esterase/lipase superfamily enzyme